MPTLEVTGRAIIRDRRRRLSYRASLADCSEGAVTFRGRLVHRTLAGEHEYPEKVRTLPLRDVEITWLDESAQVAA
jgi:hypothetical protein